MRYPYRCTDCGPFEVHKDMSQSSRPEPCPDCGTVIDGQDYGAKRVNGFVSTEGDWSGGKRVIQLPAQHPDHHVTSKREMERVYKKHGINMDTGHFVSKEAQIKATVPVHKRRGTTPQAVGGIDS